MQPWSDREWTVLGIALSGAGVLGIISILVLAPLAEDTQRLAASVLNGFEPKEEVAAPIPPAITGKAAFVQDLKTGEVLFAQSGNLVLPMASLTKLATVYVAATTLEREARITIEPEDLAPEGDTGLLVGESYRVDSLITKALVESSNDAAQALGRMVGGTEKIQATLQEAGVQIVVRTASGLDEDTGAGGEASPASVAQLFALLLKTAPWVFEPTTEAYARAAGEEIENTNEDTAIIPGLIASKTGYTVLAGGNLGIVFDAGLGHPVVAVTMGSTREERFTDIRKLRDYALALIAYGAR